LLKLKLTKNIDPLTSRTAWAWWQRVFFLPLWLLALGYQVFFYFSQQYRRLSVGKTSYPFTIISVGNIAVGGTGKSVLIPYLAALLGSGQCAIVLRGYRGSNELTGRSLLISDGKQLLHPPAVAGDEAVMHAVQLQCPVVVGPNRAASCDLLVNWDSEKRIRYVLLDDAYQHHRVKKDIELVLIDARKPFDNGYCLPLGRLREKDLSRATAVIITHGDRLGSDACLALKSTLRKKLGHDRIFFGWHKPDGFFLCNQEPVPVEQVSAHRLCALSGIGNADNFIQTLTSFGVGSVFQAPFPNHYDYSERSLVRILVRAKSQGATAMVTTTKDWVKIAPLVFSTRSQLPWYVLRVNFALLDDTDEQRLLQLLKP
jgi:tetraacyldisaccharide 4'-kinase